MNVRRGSFRGVAAAVLLCALGQARAHDSWLAVRAGDSPSLLQLELGTGARFPARDSGVAVSSVLRSGCLQAGEQRIRLLVPHRQEATFLEVRARLEAARGAACWAELKPRDVELADALVETYFSETRPAPGVSQRWARQRSAGIPWRETYRKFMRVEVPPAPAPPPGALAALRAPQGLGMEIVPLGDDPLRAGRPASFQLLRDGRPVAGHWIEFVSERNPLGVWRQSDADGKVSIALPFAGRWLARSVFIEPPADDGMRWNSRFTTVLVHVA